VLKEVADACHLQHVSYLNVVLPLDNSLSVGYQIHIAAAPSKNAVHMIEPIIQKYRLALKEDKERIVIYKPLTA